MVQYYPRFSAQLGDRLTVGRRTLTPSVVVRIHVPQPTPHEHNHLRACLREADMADWTCPHCGQRFVRRDQSHSCQMQDVADLIKGHPSAITPFIPAWTVPIGVEGVVRRSLIFGRAMPPPTQAHSHYRNVVLQRNGRGIEGWRQQQKETDVSPMLSGWEADGALSVRTLDEDHQKWRNVVMPSLCVGENASKFTRDSYA